MISLSHGINNIVDDCAMQGRKFKPSYGICVIYEDTIFILQLFYTVIDYTSQKIALTVKVIEIKPTLKWINILW